MTQSSRRRDCEQEGRGGDDFKYYNFWLLGLGVSFIRIPPARAKRPETFGFVQSLDVVRTFSLIEVWVCAKFRFVRSLRLFDSADPLVYIYIYLYYKKISPPPPCQELSGRGGRGGGGGGGGGGSGPDYSKFPQGRIILTRTSGVCSKFGFVRSLGLREVWVCSTPPILGSRR